MKHWKNITRPILFREVEKHRICLSTSIKRINKGSYRSCRSVALSIQTRNRILKNGEVGFLFSRFSILWVGLFPFSKKRPFTQIHLPSRSIIYKMVYKSQIIWMVHQGREMWFWSSKCVKHSSLKKTHICHQYAIPIFFWVEYNLWIAFISFSFKKPQLISIFKGCHFSPKVKLYLIKQYTIRNPFWRNLVTGLVETFGPRQKFRL